MWWEKEKIMKTLKPSKEWRKRLNKEGFTKKYPFKDKSLEKIKQKLLKLGGWAVILPDSQLNPLNYSLTEECLSRGKKYNGKSTLKLGEPSQCHANSATLWRDTKEKIKICTGFAMSKDGVWRIHSWGMVKSGNKKQIIETTEKRVLYFGYVLSRMESSVFSEINGVGLQVESKQKFTKNQPKKSQIIKENNNESYSY